MNICKTLPLYIYSKQAIQRWHIFGQKASKWEKSCFDSVAGSYSPKLWTFSPLASTYSLSLLSPVDRMKTYEMLQVPLAFASKHLLVLTQKLKKHNDGVYTLLSSFPHRRERGKLISTIGYQRAINWLCCSDIAPSLKRDIFVIHKADTFRTQRICWNANRISSTTIFKRRIKYYGQVLISRSLSHPQPKYIMYLQFSGWP